MGLRDKRLQEIEQHLLGSIIKDGQIYKEIAFVLKADDFFDEQHKIIYKRIESLNKLNRPICAETLIDKLIDFNNIEIIDDNYINELNDLTISTLHYKYWADQIAEAAVLRKSFKLSYSFNEQLSQKEDFNTYDIIEEQIKKLIILQNHGTNNIELPSTTEKIIENGMNNINDCLMHGVTRGAFTSFVEIDALKNGFQPGELVILAARPSMGKTALALDFMLNCASKEQSSLFISIEMSENDLFLRMLASKTDNSFESLREGRIKDYITLDKGLKQIAAKQIFIKEAGSITVNQIKSIVKITLAESINRKAPLKIVIIDYLQIISVAQSKNNRTQDVSDISRELKLLAKDFNVCVIALSQLNRAVESRNNKRPVLSDIRESGAIEQDADCVMMLYREDYYQEKKTQDSLTEVIFVKNRNGACETAKVMFTPSRTSFRDLTIQEKYNLKD